MSAVWKTLPQLLAQSSKDLFVEKQGSKIIYQVTESERSYGLDDSHGGHYYLGKFEGSIALNPIWRPHVKVSRS